MGKAEVNLEQALRPQTLELSTTFYACMCYLFSVVGPMENL